MVGFLFGLPALRLEGLYLALATFALGVSLPHLLKYHHLEKWTGGVQGIVDHVLVGNLVGFKANAAIGVSWQIMLVVIVFITSLFTGMSVLVARFAGAGDETKVDRVVYQAFLTAIGLSIGVMAPIGYFASPWLLELVNAAFQLALARRRARPEDLPPLGTIRSLHYFLPVIDEARTLDPEYLGYVVQRAQDGSAPRQGGCRPR